ncbi:MAG TPA: VTT domain-containing protein [Candidatus Limnocylindria bacterium]|nr:VTT domain-containing protein [Candidatus Limnocylindria bacterium]
MSGESLWVLCALLFVDGATFAFATTPLLLQYAKFHEPWVVAVAGGAASAAGSSVQLLILRWALGSDHRWTRRFAPSREKLAATLERYPSASFLALMVARATPLPDAPLKLVAAAVRYPIPRYATAIFLGALPYYFVLALLGRKFRIPTWILISAAVAIALGFLVDQWRRRRTVEA